MGKVELEGKIRKYQCELEKCNEEITYLRLRETVGMD